MKKLLIILLLLSAPCNALSFRRIQPPAFVEDINRYLFSLSDTLQYNFDTISQNQYMPLVTINSTQRANIKNPKEGMIIYNTTTHSVEAHNGTTWEAL